LTGASRVSRPYVPEQSLKAPDRLNFIKREKREKRDCVLQDIQTSIMLETGCSHLYSHRWSLFSEFICRSDGITEVVSGWLKFRP
jgi:hypothetical protein